MIINYGLNKKEGFHIKHMNGIIDIPEVTDDNWQFSHSLVRERIQAANPGWAITGWAYPEQKDF